MIGFTILIIVAIVIIFLFVPKLGGSAEKTRAIFRKTGSIIAGILALIWLCLFLVSSVVIIDQTEVGVIKTFGRVNGTLSPGISFINAFTDKVTKYDTRVHRAEISFSSYTKDAQPVDVAVEVQYNLLADQIQAVVTEYGTYDQLESKLSNVIEERIKVVLSRLSAMSLMETRADLSSNALIEVQELQQIFLIHFTSVIIKDVSFSDAFESSVEAKMTAEQSALRAEQEKKEAIIKAERDRETAKINAEAKIVEAKGEAEALSITKDALSAMPEAYVKQLYLEKWDGKLPIIIGGTDNPYILPSELLNEVIAEGENSTN